ncbi:hypothetical protein ACUY3K_03650 [Corynebacterium uberis]|uniref:hypothetical protein n=1 Tax=Corynebacterium TaxID=1716 RepID=UPI001D09C1F0|nr:MULTISPECIES: hypothetical protein [Corynebacterium]MCZ9309313.1 hypothetical protein [Corynebacterium sp. c6VSa_13]UDL72864.1 hypothetical protein LH391_07010 [Corynebacterium uberis]UDL76258.1 hypothetical protein LH393_02385 [Corynebacterium uberis]UDL78471.1 hypothetical protein LH394_02375 [Corynebacterium uberis]UDL80753.1 hypothetical protein LH392_02805 [Corynebacterium uberis]
MKIFHIDPVRSLLFAVVFSIILCWQANLNWMWWLPTGLVVWAVFYVANVAYVAINNKIQQVAADQRERNRPGSGRA